MSPSTVFACEAQPIVVEGLVKVLSESAEFALVGSAERPIETLRQLGALRPDILLVDQAAGLKATFQFISEVRARSPQTHPVLWVPELADVECFRALQFGVRGILKKATPVGTLLECLRSVVAGEVWIKDSISSHVMDYMQRRNAPRLTPREREIIALVCRGMKNREIGEALSITQGTVKVHLMHIFEKTGVKDRFELAIHGGRLLGEAGTVASAGAGRTEL
ncbi:MAG: LuxR C-terminal-related transcriptional regulator [Bryobacteraceae bacterium]